MVNSNRVITNSNKPKGATCADRVSDGTLQHLNAVANDILLMILYRSTEVIDFIYQIDSVPYTTFRKPIVFKCVKQRKSYDT